LEGFGQMEGHYDTTQQKEVAKNAIRWNVAFMKTKLKKFNFEF
jgi:hypothetical protein